MLSRTIFISESYGPRALARGPFFHAARGILMTFP